MKNKIILTILICLLILVFLFPSRTISIPEWEVQVVDTLDNPIPNTKIRQTWSHGSGESEETLTTNSEGIVVFPARILRQPLLFRLITGLLRRINYFVMPHGDSTGAYASVFSAEGARSNWLSYSEGRELEHKLILKDYP